MSKLTPQEFSSLRDSDKLLLLALSKYKKEHRVIPYKVFKSAVAFYKGESSLGTKIFNLKKSGLVYVSEMWINGKREKVVESAEPVGWIPTYEFSHITEFMKDLLKMVERYGGMPYPEFKKMMIKRYSNPYGMFQASKSKIIRSLLFLVSRNHIIPTVNRLELGEIVFQRGLINLNDLLCHDIYQFVRRAKKPVSTENIHEHFKNIFGHATFNGVFYRLKKLAGEGKIKVKRIGNKFYWFK